MVDGIMTCGDRRYFVMTLVSLGALVTTASPGSGILTGTPGAGSMWATCPSKLGMGVIGGSFVLDDPDTDPDLRSARRWLT